MIYKIRGGVKAYLGTLITIIGMLAAFLVSVLENVDGTITFADKINDAMFWIIWAVVLVVAVIVSLTNYNSTKNAVKESESFKATMEYYGEWKEKCQPFIDKLPAFADKKNKDIYATIEQEIVEQANLIYSKYKKDEYDLKKLERWQIKTLNKIKKINIIRLRASDITQEKASMGTYKYSHLPQGEQENSVKFISGTVLKRAVNVFAFLFIGGLTPIFTDWISGVVNAFGILSAAIGSIMSAEDYVNNVLRQRMIAKADLLREFYELEKRGKLENIPDYAGYNDKIVEI